MTNNIDEFIVSTLGKKWLSLTGVVSHALSARGLNLPGGYEDMDSVLARISALVASGILELQGELKGTSRDEYWRSCRVRVARKHPDAVNPQLLLIPSRQGDASGEIIEVEKNNFEVLFSDQEHVVLEITELLKNATWVDEGMLILCGWRTDLDASVEFIRGLTDEDARKFRIPRWIQDEEVPKCCRRKMFFVGQFDDDALASEEPEDAEVWWHDYASFYIFTCPKCLKVKAVGQQH